MEKIKDTWVVDESYVPPKNSPIVEKQINQRTGEVRFKRAINIPVVKSDRRSNFFDKLQDFMYVTNNPFLWLFGLLGFAVHYLVPLTLLYGTIQFEELRTPLVFFIITIMTCSVIFGMIRKKYYENIIALYGFILLFAVVVLLALFGLYPLFNLFS